uniref:RFX1-4/6/8-like BCD domain-containing protein n=1 Tax=Sphaeramia orbicularis TaxID=375764 RepID=A0A672YGH7_9TELE
MWSCFGTRVIRDMTLHSAVVHLIHLMFDDYERANRPHEGHEGTPESPPTTGETRPHSCTGTGRRSVGRLSPHIVSLHQHISVCVRICVYQALVQSYTLVPYITVTTAGGSTPEGGQQLSCMRSSAPVPPPSSAHRMPYFFFISRYTGSYNYGSYANQHPHSIQSQYPSLAYHRSSAQYQLNGQMSRMEPCLMGSTPRLHPAPVAPRWPDVTPANSCYTSPPMHSSRYATSGDMYSPLGPRRNSEYEHSQHFPGFAYINGEATTGWAK